ncbi:MAG TPA: hypothetical protein VD994_11865 [Prosthecobacter sp.]|nr:hypothetical protein [Prosthecobacter sp.]
MNRQAFADIESIKVRVEERRMGVRGHGNWRVHEFSGFDAIPARLQPSFKPREGVEAPGLALDVKIRELYQRRKQEGLFEDAYEVPSGDAEKTLPVARTVTVSLRYRQSRELAAKAA